MRRYFYMQDVEKNRISILGKDLKEQKCLNKNIF